MVIIVGLGLVLLKLSSSRLPATGDPLFDKYAAYIWADFQQERRKNKNAVPGRYIPLAVLDAWQMEFQDDPRYWELRSQSAYWAVMGSKELLDTIGDEKKSVDLFTASNRAAAKELRLAEEANKLDAHGLVLLWFTLKNAGESSGTQLLDKAIQQDSNYSWARYLRGLHYLEKGDKEEAARDLSEGNRLPAAPTPKPFPQDIYMQAILARRPRAALMTWSYQHEPSLLLSIRTPVVTQVKEQDYAEHPQLLSELNLFACRMFESDPGSTMTAQISYGISGWVAARVSDYSEKHKVEPELLSLLNDIDGIHSRVSEAGIGLLKSKGAPPSKNISNLPKPLANSVESVRNLVPEKQVTDMASFMRMLHDEAVYTEREYSPYFEALESVDYQKPASIPKAQQLFKRVPDPFPKDTQKKISRRGHAQRRFRPGFSREVFLREMGADVAKWASDGSKLVRPNR